jgi:hypothetical protein
MHLVCELPEFIRNCEAQGLSDAERGAIIFAVACDPKAGDLMSGTGGARKMRIAGRGKGKRGGYRVIAFYAGDDVPVFLIALLSKGERDNLSRAERNALHDRLPKLAVEYRAGVQRKVRQIGSVR